MRSLRKEDICIQNDFFDELTEDPSSIEKYTSDPTERYRTLFCVGTGTIKGYKIFDYLLLNMAFSNQISTFEIDLVNNNLFDTYVNNVLSRDDEFLKAYMRVYLEVDDLDEVYSSKKDVADIFINDSNYSPNYRLNGLMGLCEYRLNKETVNYIKENVVKIINGIKEFNDVSEEEKNNIINLYMSSIDQYQKDSELSYTYTNNK